MAVDGRLNFDTNINTKGFDKGVADVNKGFGEVNQTISKLGKTIAAALSVKALVDFGKQATETAASVNALNSQFEQTFGSLQDAASAAIQSVADESGILATRLKGVGTQIYAFAKTSGMDSVTSLNMMQDALQVAADSAAYYDRSLEDVSETLKSFLKGNYANDAALGVSATETTRNAKAMELYGEKFQDLSEAQKQLTLLQMVKDANALSGAEGQAAREAEGWENVTGNLKEAWSQLLAVVGQPILKAATAAVQHLTSALQYLTSQAKGAISALYELFGWEQENTAQTANNIQDSVSAQNDLTKAVNKTAKAQKNQLAAFDKITKLTEDESSSDDSSNASAVSAVPLNGTAKLTIEAETSEAGAKLKRFIEDARAKFDGFSGFIKKNFGGIFSGFADGFAYQTGRLKKTFGKITADLKKLSTPLTKWFKGDFLTLLTTSAQTASDIIFGLYDSFNTVFADIWDLAVYPCLSSFIDKGLPVLTQFGTQSVLTLGTLFTEVKDIFDRLWQDVAEPILTQISTIFDDVMTAVSEAWAEYGVPVFEELRTAIQTAGDLFDTFWNTIGQPVFDSLMSCIDEVWSQHLKPLLKNFLSFVGEFAKGALQIYNKFIAPVTKWLVEKLGPIFAKVIKGNIDNLKMFLGSVVDAVSGIITQFKGIATFLTGVFTGDWKKAWSGIKTYFKGVWDTIKSLVMIPFNLIAKALGTLKYSWMLGWTSIKNFFKKLWDKVGEYAKAPVNVIIGAINKLLEGVEWLVNSMVDALNTISIDVPSKLQSIVGFEKFGFDLDHISISQIPKLAQGTVVPANYGEFLAVLGDNKREAEVVSPYSTIVKAVKDAMGNTNKGGKMTVVVNIQTKSGLRTIGEVAIDEINDITDSTGVIPIKI